MQLQEICIFWPRPEGKQLIKLTWLDILHTDCWQETVCDSSHRTRMVVKKPCVKDLIMHDFLDTIVSICLGCSMEIIEIILCNIVQLEEWFIIFRHWLIYSTLQKTTLVYTNIYHITKYLGGTY
jgi:hypothetical protein